MRIRTFFGWDGDLLWPADREALTAFGAPISTLLLPISAHLRHKVADLWGRFTELEGSQSVCIDAEVVDELRSAILVDLKEELAQAGIKLLEWLEDSGSCDFTPNEELELDDMALRFDCYVSDRLRWGGTRILEDDEFAAFVFQDLGVAQLAIICTSYPTLLARFEAVVARYLNEGWFFREANLVALGALLAANRKKAILSVLEEIGTEPQHRDKSAG